MHRWATPGAVTSHNRPRHARPRAREACIDTRFLEVEWMEDDVSDDVRPFPRRFYLNRLEYFAKRDKV